MKRKGDDREEEEEKGEEEEEEEKIDLTFALEGKFGENYADALTRACLKIDPNRLEPGDDLASKIRRVTEKVWIEHILTIEEHAQAIIRARETFNPPVRYIRAEDRPAPVLFGLKALLKPDERVEWLLDNCLCYARHNGSVVPYLRTTAANADIVKTWLLELGENKPKGLKGHMVSGKMVLSLGVKFASWLESKRKEYGFGDDRAFTASFLKASELAKKKAAEAKHPLKKLAK
jgi:hypothetical protein